MKRQIKTQLDKQKKRAKYELAKAESYKRLFKDLGIWDKSKKEILLVDGGSVRQ